MAASDIEFRYRFWIFGALFCLAFVTYSIEHHNTGAALTEWIAGASRCNCYCDGLSCNLRVRGVALRGSRFDTNLGHGLSEG